MKENFVRRTMKKMAAVGIGVSMVGATLTGALAADLAEYPAPFVVDGAYDDSTVLVAGDMADAADTLGMVDISSNLQFESKVAVSTGGSTTVSVVGGKSEQIPLGDALAADTFFDTELQDDDISNLWDGEITFQGSSFDTSEELVLLATDPVMATSLTSSEDEYGTDVYLEVASRDSITFLYKFDESINLSTATTDDPLRVDFLGQRLQVTSIDSATKFTAYVGEEHYLQVDETVTIEGKTVSLVDVGTTSAIVEVDGVTEIISTGGTETVNGLEVTVDEVFSRDTREDSSANVILGLESAETYQDGDEFIGEDEDDPDWVWTVAGLLTQGTGQTLGIENDFVLNDLSDNPPAVGDCLNLPWDYVSLCHDSLSVGEDDYASYTFELEESSDFSDAESALTSEPSLHLVSSNDEGFEMLASTWTGASYILNTSSPSSVKAKEVWLYATGNNGTLANGSAAPVVGKNNLATWVAVFYKDTGDSKEKLYGHVALDGANEILRVNYGNTKDTNIVLDAVDSINTTTNMTLTLDILGDSAQDLTDGFDDMTMEWGFSSDKVDSLGATQDQEEATELKWNGTTIGTKDEDHRTRYGIIIENPESHGSSDEVELKIPQDQVFANVVISGTGATTSSGASGGAFVPADVTPVTKLASEVGTPSNHQLILVGGPCANELVDDLFDVTCDGWTLESGQAMIRVVDNGDNVALLVAGTSADDTRRASKALADWSEYDLTGTEVIVSGTSLTDINVE